MAWVLAAVTVVVLAHLTQLALWPDLAVPGALRPWAAPDSARTTTLALLLVAATAAAYWWPRRRRRRSFAVLLSLVLVLVTIPLGLASYWRCAAGQAPFWTPVYWTLALFAGEVEQPFALSAEGCPSVVPLALQVARITALCAVFVSAGAVLSALFRNQWDRVRARAARSVVVLAGLDASTVPLVSGLRAQVPSACTVIVIEPDPGSPSARESRAAGALVVTADAADEYAIRSVVRAGPTLAARTVYLLAPSAAANLRALTVVERVASGLRAPRDSLVPRFVVRLDDPWQTDDWRRHQSGRTRDWVVDAIGVHEATARMLGRRIQAHGARRVVIVGGSALALALLGEFARQEREARFLGGDAPRPLLDELAVVCPEADELVADHELVQERFGGDPGVRVTAVREAPAAERIGALVGTDASMSPGVVVFTDLRLDPHTGLAARVAARSQRALVLARAPETTGGAATEVLRNLVLFDLALAHDGLAPQDTWERTAELLHEKYLRDHPPGACPTPAQRGWGELPDFYRQDNLRQIHSTLRRAVEQGRTWEALREDPLPLPFTDAELEAMCLQEHASWMAHRRANGWRYSGVRDDDALQHDMLRSFDRLPAETAAEGRLRVRTGLVNSLELLRSLGYRPIADPEVWASYQRLGEVRAEPLAEAWAWTAGGDQPMQARAGDWRITAENDERWSVGADVFHRTYRHVAGNRYRRTGTVLARPAAPGELVISREGPTLAREGDQVLRGTAGELWLVPGDRFDATYEPAATAPAAARSRG